MESHDLTEAPIPGLVKKIALPAVVGFFFNTMYNVVDNYFGGKVSTEAQAALALSFPVFFLIIALDSGVGTGTTALISNALGAKKTDEARRYSSQAVSFGVIASLILTVFGLLVAPSIFRLLGATDQYLTIALSYMDVIFYGSIFFLMISVVNSILQSTGNTKIYRNFLIFGFFLNCLLDPWFLYGGFGLPAMGFKGIAWATVLVEAIGCIYLTRFALKTNLISFKDLTVFKPDWKVLKEISKQVFPACLNMITVGLGIFIITYFISRFGQDAVAAYGIATRIEQISLVPSIGLIIATLTLIGQNNGAKRYDRIKETLRVVIRYGLAIMTVGGILVFAFSRPLMNFFTDNQAVIDIGSKYLKIAAFIFWAYIILFTSTSALQGMKRPMYAVWIGLYRQIVGPLIIFEILVAKFSMGIYGVWWGVFIVTWSAAIITAFYLRYVLKKITA
jgi:putative MATE family efflux protein